MLLKAGGLGAFVVGGLYTLGAFDAYPKTVDASPDKVMAEMADLDIREVPGEPGSTATAAGGIMPRFQLQRRPAQLEWTVYSGSQIATRLIADFEPVDGGKRTRISAHVIRGDAPDERISPAFRSTSLTLGLFQQALDTEIAEMQAPGWGPHCDKLREELFPAGESGVAMMGLNAIQGIQKLQQVRTKLVEAGCNPDKAPGASAGFKHVTDTMSGYPDDATQRDGPRFVPGQPMIDPNANH